MALKGIIFDLDGTLVDSLSTTFDAFNHAIVAHGGQPLTPQQIMAYFGPGEGQIFARILGQEKAAPAYHLCRAYLDENIGRVPLHQGIGDVLEHLKSRGLPVAIVTGRSWDTTEIILKHHGILDRFVTVIANDHVGSPKPSPEGIRLALSRLGLEPVQAAYVGDSWVDMRASRTAGTLSIGALWDLMADRRALEAHDPHHLLERPELMRGLLD
jgi:HAD superfamily hydrolase (TIGR01509 family)